MPSDERERAGASRQGDQQGSRLDRTGLLNLYVIYLVWGSTYLAIRIAARHGSGFPPLTLGLTRALVAAAIILGYARLRGISLKLDLHAFKVLAISGLLIWTGGNGLVIWGEQRADSGLAALILSATPIWSAMIESFVDRRLPGARLTLSLLIGFIGIAVLSLPALSSGAQADALSVLAILFASLSWAAGSVYQTRNPLDLRPRVNSGFQLLLGGLGFAALLLLFPEPRPAPILEAWLAWGYLVLIGSVFAFTSYVVALRLLPTSVVMTYAYVNPVIALILGAVVLGEVITLWTLLGAALVLLGVAGIFRERYADPSGSNIRATAR